MQQKLHVFFVDPFASASFLANNLKANDICVNAIYTMTDLKSTYIKLQPELFNKTFYLENLATLPQLIETLQQEKIDRIYYGNEISVPITDQLANALCSLYANPSATSLWRSDKYDMLEAI